MATIKHENIDALNAILTVELEKNDYLPQVNKKLKEYRQQVTFKGFRPGKVPMNIIKRRVGDAILADEVNEILNKEMTAYFEQESLNAKLIGQPIPMEDNENLLSIQKVKDYTFKFELGLAPDFDVEGVSEDSVLPFLDIEVSDEMLETEIESIRKRYGQGFEEEVTDLNEDDMLVLDLVEMEGEAVKEGGVAKADAYILIKDVKTEELKETLKGLKVGDSTTVSVNDLENKDKNHIRKYVLGVGALVSYGETFQATLKEVKRVKKAEMTAEFYNQLFPQEEIADEEGFKEKLRTEMYNNLRNNARHLFYDRIFDFLMDNNSIELPEEFLNKWLKASHNVNDDFFAEGGGYVDFKKRLKWSLIRTKVAEKYSIEVKYEDVEARVRTEVLNYFNFQVPPYSDVVNNMVQRVMSDQNEVQRRYEMLLDDKVLEATSEDMGKDMQTVSKEEFEAAAKKYQEERNA